MAAPRRPKLSGCVEGMSEIVLAKEFFYPSTFKKLTFAVPKFKLGWWGGQITTIILIKALAKDFCAHAVSLAFGGMSRFLMILLLNLYFVIII